MQNNYPKKLNNKELEVEVNKHIESLKEHDPNGGLMDDLLYKQAMVTIGLTEQQNRSSNKTLLVSSGLSVLAILITLITLLCD